LYDLMAYLFGDLLAGFNQKIGRVLGFTAGRVLPLLLWLIVFGSRFGK